MKETSSHTGNSQLYYSPSSSTVLNNFYKLNASLTNKNNIITDGLKQQKTNISQVEEQNHQKSI